MKNNSIPENRKLTVAIVSPGWPLSRFPNGIVAYTHNLLIGLNVIAMSTVLAAPLMDPEVKNRFVDLTKLEPNRNIWQRLLSKIFFKIPIRCLQKIQYRQTISNSADRILCALNNPDTPFDILEIEESFAQS